MNYNDKYYNYDQCNYPDEWNCDCQNSNHNQKVFYGYFVATDKGCDNYAQKKETNFDKREDNTRQCNKEKEETNRPCENQNSRRCCCPFCTLFRGCRK